MSKLQEIRQSRGLTQNQLAMISGVKLKTIRSYEQEIRDINLAELKTLLLLAMVLRCGIDELVSDDELIRLLQVELIYRQKRRKE